MHCPRCGQQQVSEDTRFCSRCGFPLGLVSEILAHGGVLPQLADLHRKKKKFWTRKNGFKIGLVWFLVVTFLLTPLAAIADLDEGVAVLGVLGFMGGLLMMLLSRLFLEDEPKFSQFETPYQAAATTGAAVSNYLSGNASHQNAALPPQQSQPAHQDFVPAPGSWKAPNTGELVPHSVTDETTKLLRKRDE
ncbi:MAG TPA: zinc ribbon domain-containing protein [Pyrinomonadaceae bacterium]|nr:zinc ribbon domain-containing protein [Pyrinomonadaceae bacterium]